MNMATMLRIFLSLTMILSVYSWGSGARKSGFGGKEGKHRSLRQEKAPVALVIHGEAFRKPNAGQYSRVKGLEGKAFNDEARKAQYWATRSHVNFAIAPLEKLLKTRVDVYIFTYCSDKRIPKFLKKWYGGRLKKIECIKENRMFASGVTKLYSKLMMKHVITSKKASYSGILFTRPDINFSPEFPAFLAAADLDAVLFPFPDAYCKEKTCICKNGHDRVADPFQWIPSSIVKSARVRRKLFGVTKMLQAPTVKGERSGAALKNDLLSECALDSWAVMLADKSTPKELRDIKFGFMTVGEPLFKITTNPSSVCRVCLTYDSDPAKIWNPLYHFAGRHFRKHDSYVIRGTKHMIPVPARDIPVKTYKVQKVKGTNYLLDKEGILYELKKTKKGKDIPGSAVGGRNKKGEFIIGFSNVSEMMIGG